MLVVVMDVFLGLSFYDFFVNVAPKPLFPKVAVCNIQEIKIAPSLHFLSSVSMLCEANLYDMWHSTNVLVSLSEK